MHHPFGKDRTSNNLDTGPATKTRSGRRHRRRGYSISFPRLPLGELKNERNTVSQSITVVYGQYTKCIVNGVNQFNVKLNINVYSACHSAKFTKLS